MIHVLALWVPVGVAFALLLIGLGLLIDRAGKTPLPPALLVPIGLCAAITASGFAAMVSLPASVLVAILIVAALAGLWLGRGRRIGRAGWWGVAAVAATWGIYTMTVALTGQATYPGYTVLGDTAIHLVGADMLPGRGGSWANLPGSFHAFYTGYYDNGYPKGGASTLGMLSTLTGLDPLRTIYPLIVMAMTVLTAAVWTLLAPVVGRPWARAGIAVIAAIPALTFSFVLQSSLKEVLEMATLATLFASTTTLFGILDDTEAREWRDLARDALAPAVALGAAVASIGLAAGIYVLPGALIVVLALLVVIGWRRTLIAGVSLAVLAVVLVIPSLIGLGQYVSISGGVLTSQVELGNLYAGPLIVREIWGVWFQHDFRQLPYNLTNTTRGADVVVALVVFGCLRLLAPLIRRARPAIPLMGWVVAVAVATPIVIGIGSPWADAKAMAIAGPTIMTAAGVGFWWLASSKWLRLPAVVLGGVAAAAVLVSVGDAAYQVGTAPEKRFDELTTIDNRFAGQGPMIVPEFEELDRHLLRKVPATFVSDSYAPIQSKGVYANSADTDVVDQTALQTYKLILVRSGPSASRPPSNYVRRWSGRWYEVWAKDPSLPVPRVHKGLGDIATGGTAVPTCTSLQALAKRAQPGEQLVAATRAIVPTQVIGKLPLPIGWSVDGGDPRQVFPYGSGHFDFTMKTKAAPGALVDVWMEGSFTRTIKVVANGTRGQIGPMALNSLGGATRVVTTHADASGNVRIQITRPAKALRTGWGNSRALWGPVSVTPHDPTAIEPLVRLAPKDVKQLCGKALDWVELVPSKG